MTMVAVSARCRGLGNCRCLVPMEAAISSVAVATSSVDFSWSPSARPHSSIFASQAFPALMTSLIAGIRSNAMVVFPFSNFWVNSSHATDSSRASSRACWLMIVVGSLNLSIESNKGISLSVDDARELFGPAAHYLICQELAMGFIGDACNAMMTARNISSGDFLIKLLG